MPEVRLVGPNGEQVGIVRVEDALRLAQEADLDLVEVAPDARPPVCKLMDYGKFKYEADMKAREARRNQANTVLKEIRFRLKIDPHDYGTKKGHVERFLKAGDKVKVMIMFRGREQSRPEMGLRLLQRLADDVAELGFVESAPRQDGRNMIMVLGPTTKKKSEARQQAKRQREVSDERPASEAPVEAPAATDAVAEAPVVAPAPAEVPAEAPVAAPAPVEAAPAPTTAPAPAAAEAPRPPAPRPATSTPRPAARTATTSAAPAEPAAEPKPAAESKPAATAKPSAAPKPTAAPKPMPMPPKPTAPKPAAPAAKPRATKPKPPAES